MRGYLKRSFAPVKKQAKRFTKDFKVSKPEKQFWPAIRLSFAFVLFCLRISFRGLYELAAWMVRKIRTP